MTSVGVQIEADGDTFEANYGAKEPFIPYSERSGHAMTVAKALYNTAMAYKSAQDAGYTCYAITASASAAASEQYSWGPSFMNYLAQGEKVSFDGIYNEAIYLLDVGSRVIDVIGSG